MHVIRAHAAAATGNKETHRDAHAEAQRAVAAIADEEDQKIVERIFNRVPAP